MAAWPSKLITRGRPHRAATASKSRPMLLVRGQLTERASAANSTVELGRAEPVAVANDVFGGRVAQDFIEHAQGRAARLVHGQIAAGQREGPQVGSAA